MKNAAIKALKPAVRTAAQTAGGLLGSITILNMTDIAPMGSVVIVAGAASLLAGVVAWLMNFAEALEETGKSDARD